MLETIAPSNDVAQFADALSEPAPAPRRQIDRAVRVLGPERALAFLEQAGGHHVACDQREDEAPAGRAACRVSYDHCTHVLMTNGISPASIQAPLTPYYKVPYIWVE